MDGGGRSVGYDNSTTDSHSQQVTINDPNGRAVDRNSTDGDNRISRLTSLSDGAATLGGDDYFGLGAVVEHTLTPVAICPPLATSAPRPRGNSLERRACSRWQMSS